MARVGGCPKCDGAVLDRYGEQVCINCGMVVQYRSARAEVTYSIESANFEDNHVPLHGRRAKKHTSNSRARLHDQLNSLGK